ncbi:MAG: hypothetical protein M1150_04040 [Patescibacteria group bacterium]|nr:hypothetical protein [Patescibacteria group bacterium]
MKKWQKYLLIFLVSFSTMHLIRDIFQDNGVSNALSTTLVKSNPSSFSHVYWSFFNGYILMGYGAISGTICLVRNKFGLLGYSVIGTTLLFWLAWSFYWLFL